jgi:hypothetical protein
MTIYSGIHLFIVHVSFKSDMRQKNSLRKSIFRCTQTVSMTIRRCLQGFSFRSSRKCFSPAVRAYFRRQIFLSNNKISAAQYAALTFSIRPAHSFFRRYFALFRPALFSCSAQLPIEDNEKKKKARRLPYYAIRHTPRLSPQQPL